MHEAKVDNEQQVVFWGTSKPKREFLVNEDMAEVCVNLIGLDDEKYGVFLDNGKALPINVGVDKDLTIT